MDGGSQREGRVAVEGVQNFVLDLTDGVAVKDPALDLLLELFGRQRNRLRPFNKQTIH